MMEKPVIRNLDQLFAGRLLLPTLTRYNRLENRPRTDNFNRALRAEVRDALWMLCKQWQMGEFLGDDAGSPIYAKMHVKREPITKYQLGENTVQQFNPNIPLETTVERRAFPFSAGNQIMSLDLRIQMGRRWLKMIPQAFAQQFKDKYKIASPDPTKKEDSFVCAHAEVWQQFNAMSGRAMDGAAFYFHLKKSPANLASDGIAGLSPTQKSDMDTAGGSFVDWFERLYIQPGEKEGDAWLPERLEYQFACAVPGGDGEEKVLAAEHYYQGRLDWYNFDWDKSRKNLGELLDPLPQAPTANEYITRSFIPTPLRFNGMPDSRWWAFEDGKTNFGDIKPGTTDLPKLLLIEFGLVYANDWFLLPYTVPTGSALNIQGLAITNTFGERFWIEPAGSGVDKTWQRWGMFNLNIKGQAAEPADMTLLILPTVPKVLEGKPLEAMTLMRDEMANMVWGIETTVPMPHGSTQSGNIAAAEFHTHLQELLDKQLALTPPPPKDWKAPFRYDIMTTVPENWIPFVPEHVPSSNRQIQLRRAAMPRFLEHDPAPTYERVRPRTTLLREGLDINHPYHLHEEEVSRAGTQVLQAFQRTRWTNGQVIVWLGVRKQTGRGEGHSGLAFDGVEAKK